MGQQAEIQRQFLRRRLWADFDLLHCIEYLRYAQIESGNCALQSGHWYIAAMVAPNECPPTNQVPISGWALRMWSARVYPELAR